MDSSQLKTGSFQAANVASMMRQRMADSAEASPELALRQIVEYLNGTPESFVPLLGLLSLKGKRFTLKDHFPMEPVFKCQLPSRQLMKCARQVSKCCIVDSPIRLADGRTVRADQIVPGDQVISISTAWQSVRRRVLNVFRNGEKSVYELITRLGSKVQLSAEHRLRTLHGYTPISELKSGDRIAALKSGGEFGSLQIPRSRIVLTAYLIGDGSITERYLAISSSCSAIIQEALSASNEARLHGSKGRSAKQIYFSRSSTIAQWMKADGLWNTYSHTKFLPSWVFQLSREDTALFLSRLWATDGMIKRKDSCVAISYCSVSKRLAMDVRSLLNKLGIQCSIKQRTTSCKGKPGMDAYIVRVETQEGWQRFMHELNVPGKPACQLPTAKSNNNRDTLPIEVNRVLKSLFEETSHGHANSLRQHKLRMKAEYPVSRSKVRRYLELAATKGLTGRPEYSELENLHFGNVAWDEVLSITEVGSKDTVDIEIEHEHNYILDGLVSHNSMSLSADGVLRAATTPFLQTLYVTPRFEQIRRLSTNYVRPLIRNSIIYPLMVDESCVQQVLQRSFINESAMFFSFCLLDVDRIRGLSVDIIKFDEIQDMDYDFIPVIMECKSHSVLGLTAFSGTPKTLDNTIEALWQLSSQGEWVVPCFRCGYWNMACVAVDLNKMIGKETVVCAKCQKPVDPSTGHWYHTAAKDHGDFPGYHVPQPIMPLHYASPQKWRELLVKQQTYSPQKFLNEVLGESCDMGVKLITLTDIKNASILGPNDYYKAAQLFKNCELRILAVDWGGGGAEENSYTVGSLIGWNPYEAKIQCHYAVRMNAGYNHQDEAALLLKLFTETGCHIFAHDYGGSGAVRETLMIQAGLPMSRIMNISYVRATSKNILYYNPPVAQGTSRGYYALDKARSLVLQATCLKSGVIQLPEYESAKDITRDLLALLEDKHEMPGGSDVYLIRRQPKLSDDFAHSLNFGCVAIWHSKQNWPDLATVNQIRLPDNLVQELQPPTGERG
jgi:intein/homing endonuclease